MFTDSSPYHKSLSAFEEEMAGFCMDSIRPSTAIAPEIAFEPAQLIIQSSLYTDKIKHLAHRSPIFDLNSVDGDQETRSVGSYSILSDDTTPRSASLQLPRFLPKKESEYFVNLYNMLDRAFSQWESKVGDQKAHLLQFENTDDMYIELPSFTDRGVLMGKKPDGNGVWMGRIYIPGPECLLHRLKANWGKRLLGIEIGFIEDFDCYRSPMGGAILFFGRDRNVYYTDEGGDFDQDDEGICTFIAHGPYDLRMMGTGSVLDPWANSHPPESWPDELKPF